MTKSRQSAIKLRLSRIIRCLVALGCLKLAIMGVALLDLPMPSWGENGEKTERMDEPGIKPGEKAGEFTGRASSETVAEAEKTVVGETATEVEHPQGKEAAELAAAAKPRRFEGIGGAILPAPLTGSGESTLKAPSTFTPSLPSPPALAAPLAKAGVVLPTAEKPLTATSEESVWDMLDLKSLPIPGLGSVSVAQAASVDMPVPNAPRAQSPFAPAEQVAPLGGSAPIVLPGAPPLPANLPNGQSAQLPPRQYSPLNEAPAPNVTHQSSALDPNVKTQEMARQQQDMLMLRQQMDQRLKDLQSAEDKMKEVLREAKDIEDKKVKSLVLMYANMKPRMAAQAMEKMDERIAVRILAGMAPKQSGEILTYTNPAKTAKFTEMLTRLRMNEM